MILFLFGSYENHFRGGPLAGKRYGKTQVTLHLLIDWPFMKGAQHAITTRISYIEPSLRIHNNNTVIILIVRYIFSIQRIQIPCYHIDFNSD